MKKNEKTLTKAEFFELVAGVAVSEANNKKKDKIKTLEPPAELRSVVDEIIEWKKKEKEAKAEREFREGQIIDFVKEIQDKDGFSGDFQKSYRVKGIVETVTYVSSDKFSAIKSEELEQIKRILGDKFEDYIERVVTLTVKEEVMHNTDLQKELMELIPPEKFSKFFTAEIQWKPVPDFDKKRYALPKSKFEEIASLIKQAKPSIR